MIGLRRMLGFCEHKRCRKRWNVVATLQPKTKVARPVKWRLCDEHADQMTHIFAQGAKQIDVWDDDGTHAQLHDFETAARRLAIEKAIPVRQARRELERRRGK